MLTLIFAQATTIEMSSSARRDVYQAIADPTRRQIINLIANEGMSMNNIAARFEMSRPAISQQVKILAECGLVIIKQEGREHICTARLEALAEVSTWIEQYRQLWDERFTRLDGFLTGNKKNTPKHK